MTSSQPLDQARPEATPSFSMIALINPLIASISLSSVSFLATERGLTHRPQIVPFIIVPSLQIKYVLLAENHLCNSEADLGMQMGNVTILQHVGLL